MKKRIELIQIVKYGIVLVAIAVVLVFLFVSSLAKILGLTKDSIVYVFAFSIAAYFILGVLFGNRHMKNLEANLQARGFERSGKTWRRLVGDVDLEMGASTVVTGTSMNSKGRTKKKRRTYFWVRSNVDWPKIFTVESEQPLFVRFVQTGGSPLEMKRMEMPEYMEREVGSADGALEVKRLIDSGLAAQVVCLHWDKIATVPTSVQLGPLPLKLGFDIEERNIFKPSERPSYDRMVGVVLNMPARGLHVCELEESDITTIAEFFSALKRAGSR